MITLTDSEKEFVREKLKPYLQKNDWQKVRELAPENVLAFLSENDFPIFAGLTKITKGILDGSDVMKVTVPNEIEVIGDGAFKYCDKLSTVIIGDNVEKIGEGAFLGTGISKIVIPESVTTLGKDAFKACANLKLVYLPDSITTLPEGLFTNCPDDIEIRAHSRKDMPKSKHLKCPKNELEWYTQHLKALTPDMEGLAEVDWEK